MSLKVFQIPALEDNYNFVLKDEKTGSTATVDPSGENPVASFLQEKGWSLHQILITHHHWDHVGGNRPLKKLFGAKVIGSYYDQDRIPDIDHIVADGDHVQVGECVAQVRFVPGHTRGHIAFWFPEDNILFCGDTLFGLGCGRLFEGTAKQLWTSLQWIKSLPPQTLIYCAHEYTLKNAHFALSLEPNNIALKKRVEEIRTVRSQNQPTVPLRLESELQTNPFLRTSDLELRHHLNMVHASDLEVFTELRRRRDLF